MSLQFQITIKASGHTLSQGVQLAAHAGIQIVDSRNHCKIYTSKIDDREYRLIGALGFPSNEKPKLWQRIGCTSSDIAGLLNFAALHAHGGLSQFPRLAWTSITPEIQGVFVSRALDDYGDDLSAVVAIPEAVTFTRGLEDTVHYTNNATS